MVKQVSSSANHGGGRLAEANTVCDFGRQAFPDERVQVFAAEASKAEAAKRQKRNLDIFSQLIEVRINKVCSFYTQM